MMSRIHSFSYVRLVASILGELPIGHLAYPVAVVRAMTAVQLALLVEAKIWDAR